MRLMPILAIAGLGAYLFSRVRRPRRLDPDERIRRSVAALLPHDRDLRVVVKRGVVSLRGSISRQERDDLLAAVLATPGVTEVSNLLEVEEPGMGHPR